MPGRIALVGSGEYLPEMQDLEEWLLTDKPPRYVQLATAASLEGEESLRRWHDLGAQAAQRLGVEQVVVDVRTRQDADNADYVEAITGAGLIYLSGGNPQTSLPNTDRHSGVGCHPSGLDAGSVSRGLFRRRYGTQRLRSGYSTPPLRRSRRPRPRS